MVKAWSIVRVAPPGAHQLVVPGRKVGEGTYGIAYHAVFYYRGRGHVGVFKRFRKIREVATFNRRRFQRAAATGVFADAAICVPTMLVRPLSSSPPGRFVPAGALCMAYAEPVETLGPDFRKIAAVAAMALPRALEARGCANPDITPWNTRVYRGRLVLIDPDAIVSLDAPFWFGTFVPWDTPPWGAGDATDDAEAELLTVNAQVLLTQWAAFATACCFVCGRMPTAAVWRGRHNHARAVAEACSIPALPAWVVSFEGAWAAVSDRMRPRAV